MSITNQKIHFIAIGGGAMHQLAIALKKNQNQVSGSDDEIFEPSLSALRKEGLLPEAMGWFPERIHEGLDLIVLGMHARSDNPELVKAKALGLKILSYPELIYQHAEQKQRIVIAGSHGKTTTTAMIMHVLQFLNRKFDYLIGAKVPGFEYQVRLSDDAPIMVIEGDEYPASAEQPIPKFLFYKHHIGLVTGIAWDHINAYPTEHAYVRQFDHFADSSPKAGILVFNEDDDLTSVVCKKEREDVTPMEYSTYPHVVKNGKTYLLSADKKETEVQFFGEHNLSNAAGAKTLLSKLAVTEEEFLKAIASFKPAANRLEKIAESGGRVVYKDFAHAPSKVAATLKAVRAQYPGDRLIAVLELHTYSSLNPEFLTQYAQSLDQASIAFVYANPEVSKHKKLPPLSDAVIKSAFNRSDLHYFENSKQLLEELNKLSESSTILLLMTSGNFDGQNLEQFAQGWAAKA